LTTDATIANGGLLKFYLMRLNSLDRNTVLQSSFLRTTGFGQFP
jgi:hypothetical protein